VFDFDQTISKLSIPEEIDAVERNLDTTKFATSIDRVIDKHGMSNLISEPFLNLSFINYLRNVRRNHNVKIVIVSYGVNSGNRLILDKLNISDIFDDVITPINFGLTDGIEYFDKFDGKNKIIQLVQTRYNVPDANVLLLDDNETNIRYAKIKYSTSYVPGSRGITKTNVNDIKQFIDNRICSP
jgi:FMN phosphatase YigB (HAD superfamily)